MNWPGQDRWRALPRAAGAAGAASGWYDRLASAYAEPHRHYHTRQHIAECLAEFDPARHLAEQAAAVELALWFHDAVYDPNQELSPDRKRTLELVEKDRPFITDLASGRKREFKFHPDDRRSASPDSVQWASDCYLVFQGPRTALIDADTLKMSLATGKDAGINSVKFSSDFRSALGTAANGCPLGTVELPAAVRADRGAVLRGHDHDRRLRR